MHKIVVLQAQGMQGAVSQQPSADPHTAQLGMQLRADADCTQSVSQPEADDVGCTNFMMQFPSAQDIVNITQAIQKQIDTAVCTDLDDLDPA